MTDPTTIDCQCDGTDDGYYLCDRPWCVANRAEEEARWYALFEASPPAHAYTREDLRAFGVYGEQPYKYEDAEL